MASEYYEEALKRGKKDYRAKVIKGEFPYLPVLDQILAGQTLTEYTVGLKNIPLNLVVGTCTMGRTLSFASNFMPIMDQKTEFSFKWKSLAEAQVSEGIRDPIKVYEYLNRYYVMEGNKRVSVLKFFGADEIAANVIRKVPKKSDEPFIRRYFELCRFKDQTGLYSLEFSKEGTADQLLEQIGVQGIWTDQDRESFRTLLFRFHQAYEFRGGKKLPITEGDALAAFINIFGYDKAQAMSARELNDNILKVWNEFLMLKEHHAVDIVLSDKKITQEKKTNLISLYLPGMLPGRKQEVVFLYPKEPEQSNWLYAHELGRQYLTDTFPKEITTGFVSNVNLENAESIIEDCITSGADIIFAVAPQLLKPCLKAAVAHPEVKILNCSLNTAHQYIRTYYSRMYEAKFISGMIAGAMVDNNNIAYIADYPLYGMIANINAFALGVASTNPNATVYLDWSTRKGFDKERFLLEHDIHIVSDQDMVTPTDPNRRYGLYRLKDGNVENLVAPIWNWGVFYEKLIRGILAGSYQQEAEDQALNYWWGMPEGVIDLIVSKQVPKAVQHLCQHVQNDIIGGFINVFSGEFRSQDGAIRNHEQESMNPRNIMKMDYLLDNINGSIPPMEDYVEAAKPVIQQKGVEKK